MDITNSPLAINQHTSCMEFIFDALNYLNKKTVVFWYILIISFIIIQQNLSLFYQNGMGMTASEPFYRGFTRTNFCIILYIGVGEDDKTPKTKLHSGKKYEAGWK